MKLCKLETCDKTHDSHGYCANHARQFRRWGRIRPKAEISKEISERNRRVKPALGVKWTESAKKAQSERFKGRRLNTGRTHFLKDQDSWNKGLRFLRVAGESNNNWKGDKVSYRSLHKWVARWLGAPDSCSSCLTSGLSGHQIHWSNISGDYHRDLTDWQRLCAKCHKAYDKELRLARLGGY